MSKIANVYVFFFMFLRYILRKISVTLHQKKQNE